MKHKSNVFDIKCNCCFTYCCSHVIATAQYWVKPISLMSRISPNLFSTLQVIDNLEKCYNVIQMWRFHFHIHEEIPFIRICLCSIASNRYIYCNLIPRPRPAFHRLQYASDRKLGGALERGYIYCTYITYQVQFCLYNRWGLVYSQLHCQILYTVVFTVITTKDKSSRMLYVAQVARNLQLLLNKPHPRVMPSDSVCLLP